MYDIKDKFLYEILDDYQNSNDDNEKIEIFDSFIKLIFKNKTPRQIIIKNIKFKILDDRVDTPVGQVLKQYENISYNYSKTKTNQTDFASLIRQKTNNIYNNYCESKICTRKEYMSALKFPKQMYYRWINGEDFEPQELNNEIKEQLEYAQNIKMKYGKQKMQLNWKDYKNFVYDCLHKAFNNFIPLDDFEDKSKFVTTTDVWCEDNFVIRYLCKCLDGGIKDFQKEYYGLYRKGKRSKLIYNRCEDCGKMFWSNKQATKTFRCKECQHEKNKEKKRNYWRKKYGKIKN